MLGVDISYSRLTDDQAERLKAAGWEVLFQCLWIARETPAPAIRNLEIAVSHGLLVAGYISVNGSRPGAWHVDQARAVVPTHIWDKLLLTPIDVELDGIPNSTIRDAVERTVALGKRRAIYTAEWCWRDKQGNSQTFEDCLLWNAAWTGQPLIRPVTYGKWAGVVGQQWSGGAYVEGVYADRNLFVKELLQEEAMHVVYTATQQRAIARVWLDMHLQQSAEEGQAIPWGGLSTQRWAQAWTALNGGVPPDILPPFPRLQAGANGDLVVTPAAAVIVGEGDVPEEIAW